jgi:predicted site-specific integrase-resolvase
MTKKQAAEALGVTTRTIDSWRARGIDLGVRFTPTGRVRFSGEAVAKLVRDRKPRRYVKATPEAAEEEKLV